MDPSHGRAEVGRQKLCADTGYILEDPSGAMDDRDGWRERLREIRAAGRHDDDDDETIDSNYS